MTRSRFLVLGVVSAALVLVAAFARPAVADQPEPQLRFFAVIVPTPDTPPPDLTSSDSTLLVVNDHVSPANNLGIQFCANAPSELLAGTQWGRAKTMHVTRGGVEKYTVLWLDGRPVNGARAWTGPDGDAQLFAGPFYVRTATGSGGECGTNKFWVDDNPLNAAFTMYVGFGWFSK